MYLENIPAGISVMM